MGERSSAVRERAARWQRCRTGGTRLFGTWPRDAISDDGSRVIWTGPKTQTEASATSTCATPQTEQTLQLDAAQGVTEPQHGSAQFQTASSDGSTRVLHRQATADRRTRPRSREHRKARPVRVRNRRRSRQARVSSQGSHVRRQRRRTRRCAGPVLGASEDGTSVSSSLRACSPATKTATAKRAEPAGTTSTSSTIPTAAWIDHVHRALSSEDSPEWEGNGTRRHGIPDRARLAQRPLSSRLCQRRARPDTTTSISPAASTTRRSISMTRRQRA